MESRRISHESIRSFRLRAHNLVQKLPLDQMTEAVGACGLQNTPPGAWETSLYNRVSGVSLEDMRKVLLEEKSLLQAWSFRGAPVVFPTKDRGVFLSPLAAQKGEEPWIYTTGLSGALDFMGMDFYQLLPLVEQAALTLNSVAVTGKEELDRLLAGLIEDMLPPDKLELWRAGSIYADPGRQTMGQAAVSFMLRPCSFLSRVVFGAKDRQSPTFTSLKNWAGLEPEDPCGDPGELVRRFLHCYGPADQTALMAWLGSSRRQAARLWDEVKAELCPVEVDGKRRYMLKSDMDELAHGQPVENSLLMLGPHDPYLDIRQDRHVLLADAALQRTVWRTTANPGVIAWDGRVAGTWRAKTARDRLEIAFRLFEPLSSGQRQRLLSLAEGYAAFRRLNLAKCGFED